MVNLLQPLINRYSKTVDLEPRGPFYARSPKWPTMRKRHLIVQPVCQICGHGLGLNVHHVYPVYLFPELELDPDNLITLGEYCPSGNHHFLFGHFLNWKKYNPRILEVSALFLEAIKKKPSALLL